MNQDILKTKSFREWQESMDFNGYAFYNSEEINKESDNPCYIPESGESLKDIFSYQDLIKEGEEFLKKNKEYFEGENIVKMSANDLVRMFFDEMDLWCYFSTFLDNMLNDEIFEE